MSKSFSLNLFLVMVIGAASTTFAADAAPRPEESYESADFGELPAELPVTLAGTQILVDGVRVNGSGPYRFLLDTGAMGGGRIDVSLAGALQLESVDTVLAGDGTDREGVEMPIYRLDSLQLGPLEFRGVRVLSRDYNRHGAAVRGHIDGVLGFHLFRDVLLTIDYPARALRLEQGSLPSADGRKILPMVDGGRVPTIGIALAGRSLQAHLDTGAMGGIGVPDEIAGSLPLAGEPRRIGEARTLTGAFPISAVQLDGDARIGAHDISRPEIIIGPPLQTVNLGGRILDQFVLTFDQRNALVRLERPTSGGIPDAPAGTTLGGVQAVHVPMRVEHGRPVIDVILNDKGPFPLVLDTGATGLILARSLVHELGLRSEGKVRVGDPSAPAAIEADAYTVERVAIGDAGFESLSAISWDDPLLERSLGNARGIIGLSTFADCLLTLDYPGRRVAISRGALSGNDGSVRFRWDKWIPTIDLKIGEITVDAHLDSGNMGLLTLPARIEDRLHFAEPPRLAGRARTASGEFEIRRGRLADSVRMAGVVFEQPEVNITDRFGWANIGHDVLKRFAVTIDQVNQRVRFSEADAPDAVVTKAESAARGGDEKRFGFMLAIGADDRLEVLDTLNGGIAERAGMRAGDVIVRINGNSVDSMESEARHSALRSSPLRLLVRRDGAEVELFMSWADEERNDAPPAGSTR